MDNSRSRQALTPDAAISYGVTVICCQFMSDRHTRDIMDNLPLLLDRASDNPAFLEIRLAAQRLIDARRADLATGGKDFHRVRIDERKAVEAFAWKRFCALFETALAQAPRKGR